WCYPRIPILSKTWINANLAQLPLPLLHSMYALCLCFPLEFKPVIMSGTIHFNYAKRHALKEIENGDPFTIVTLIHLGYFAIQAGQFSSCISFFGMATGLAQLMGIDQDYAVKWNSKTGVQLGDDQGTGQDFLRSIWFLLYIYDYYIAHLFKLPLIINSEVSAETIAAYTSPNKDDPSNISEK
ncbi:hypothetical protein HDU91_003147, partial [Kappamyces sp. JEL0680]